MKPPRHASGAVDGDPTTRMDMPAVPSEEYFRAGPDRPVPRPDRAQYFQFTDEPEPAPHTRSPWDVLGWLLVAIAALILVFVAAVLWHTLPGLIGHH